MFLCQDQYVDTILKRYGMQDCKSVTHPMAAGIEVHLVPFLGAALKEDIELYGSMIGSLNYLICQTRYDICFAISKLSKYLMNPLP